MTQPLLSIEGLKTHFKTDDGMIHAVDGVDLAIQRGETLGVVGESGCGKTVTAMTVMKLVAMPPGKIVAGRILWQGRDLVPLGPDEMRSIRAKEIAIIFQEPMTSLNPVYSVGEQIAEVIRLHEGLGQRAALEKTIEMLKLVHISNPERRVHDYPHQFSGGMRQRVMIAMALSCRPKLLIADEPTTALDVTIQGEILALLHELVADSGMALLMISHDLGVMARMVARLLVMYGGTVVESGPTAAVFARRAHPYTRGLYAARPRLGTPTVDGRKPRLVTIPGRVPELIDLPSGCPFADRCAWVVDACRAAPPPPVPVEPGHAARCIRLDAVEASA